MRSSKFIAALIVAVVVSTSLWGQTVTRSRSDEETTSTMAMDASVPAVVTTRMSLAMSTPDYPVTPGDTIAVSYLGSLGSAAMDATVNAQYGVDLGFFGTLDATGLSFLDLKSQIVETVKRAYPNSYPRVALLTVGQFAVPVGGAVTRVGDVNAWGLMRLSDAVSGRIAPHGSERFLTITDANGRSRRYDLFLARRSQNASQTQNPYLKPGDSIVIGESRTRIQVSGEVHIPGTYEVLAGENLSRIIDFYGGGITPRGDERKVQITRFDRQGGEVSNLVLDLRVRSAQTARPANGDVIRVQSLLSGVPVVYLEGAVEEEPVGVAAEDLETPTPAVSQRIREAVYENDTLYSVLGRRQEVIHSDADLTQAFIRREGRERPIEIDMERLLHGKDLSLDVSLITGDRIIIPFGAFEVFAEGEVKSAGIVEIDSLTRLSGFLSDRTTAYASTRDVLVTSSVGRPATYDLFLADRFGRLDQDPYLQPGDSVTVGHADRRVTISGEVERPGTYQLLSSDGIEELIDYYGSNATDLADLSRIEVIRRNTGSDEPIERFELDIDEARQFPLRNLDEIRIPNRFEFVPVIYLEGAVDAAGSSTTLRIQLRSGDALYSVLKRNTGQLRSDADLSRAFVRRAGGSEVVEINMERLLYQHDLSLDTNIAAGDRIVVPYGETEVFITGEVDQSEWVEVQPLTRLSQVVTPRLTDYSSIRAVAVTSQDGATKSYDLFLARRFGRKDQDPYLAAGDTIEVGRSGRKVSIQGEVERPGTYELLEEDTIETLVSYYGAGFTESANRSAAEVVSLVTDGEEITRKSYVDLRDLAPTSLELRDRDTVVVPSKLVLMPYVFFEGAVSARAEDAETTDAELSGTSRFRYRFHAGELLSETLAVIEARFTPESDLANAYVIRQSGEVIPVDMEELLRRSEDAQNLELANYDRFIVPFKQYFVLVAGAVHAPGRYPYIPDRTYEYYVDLAGGIDRNLHVGERVQITDIDDRPHRGIEHIEPEMKIYVPTNNPLYYINQLSGVLSVLGTILSILAVTGAFGGG